MQGQAYTIIVELVLPESPVNQQLGKLRGSARTPSTSIY